MAGHGKAAIGCDDLPVAINVIQRRHQLQRDLLATRQFVLPPANFAPKTPQPISATLASGSHDCLIGRKLWEKQFGRRVVNQEVSSGLEALSVRALLLRCSRVQFAVAFGEMRSRYKSACNRHFDNRQ